MSAFEIIGIAVVLVAGMAVERYIGVLSRFHKPKA